MWLEPGDITIPKVVVGMMPWAADRGDAPGQDRAGSRHRAAALRIHLAHQLTAHAARPTPQLEQLEVAGLGRTDETAGYR